MKPFGSSPPSPAKTPAKDKKKGSKSPSPPPPDAASPRRGPATRARTLGKSQEGKTNQVILDDSFDQVCRDFSSQAAAGIPEPTRPHEDLGRQMNLSALVLHLEFPGLRPMTESLFPDFIPLIRILTVQKPIFQK